MPCSFKGVAFKPFLGSDGVVRPSIPAFRADDSGSNPGRSNSSPGIYYSNN